VQRIGHGLAQWPEGTILQAHVHGNHKRMVDAKAHIGVSRIFKAPDEKAGTGEKKQ